MTTTIRGTDNSAAAPALTGNDSDTGIYFPAADTLGLVTGGSEAVRVDSSGSVGIGTNSPNTYAGDTTLTINGSSGGGEIDFESAGTLKSYIYGSASALNFVTTTSIPLVFATNSTERIRVTDNGLTFNGDTAAANALDDYEEGTWTPTTNGDATGSFSAQAGTYTKIGNQVTVHGQFVVATNFTSALIGGLPFVPKVANPSISGVYSIYVVRNDAGNRYIQLVNSATTVTFQSTMTGTASSLTTSDGVVRFGITYQTT